MKLVRLKEIAAAGIRAMRQVNVKADNPLEKELQKILGTTRWNNLKVTGVRQDELIMRAAACMHVPELQLVKVLAVKLGVRVNENPAKMDLREILKRNEIPGQPTFESFENAGAIATSVHGMVTGLVCSNPYALKPLGNFYSGSNLQLATRASIATALLASKQLLANKKKVGSAGDNPDVASLVIRQIIDEAKSYQANTVTLRLAGQPPSYSFKNADGRMLSGTLLPKAATLLADHLSGVIAEQEGRINEIPDTSLYVSADALVFTVKLGGQSTFISGVGRPKNVKCQSRHVLLVDDSETFSKVVARFLEKEGISVQHAIHVADAIHILSTATEMPSLIISDVHMPGLNGHAFVDAVKNIEACSAIPIIMLTSDEASQTELELIRNGVQAFVSKNKHPEILKAHVVRILEEERLAA